MKSAIAEAINLVIEPVALVFTDEKPAGAVQFEPGKWGCVLSMFGAAATKGRTVVFDSETFGEIPVRNSVRNSGDSIFN
ncbi:MAG: DUF169 domain-containing protein, partial [Geobacter sp.]|nr:DUF169 domain-containing protein [Geobacter sp.]